MSITFGNKKLYILSTKNQTETLVISDIDKRLFNKFKDERRFCLLTPSWMALMNLEDKFPQITNATKIVEAFYFDYLVYLAPIIIQGLVFTKTDVVQNNKLFFRDRKNRTNDELDNAFEHVRIMRPLAIATTIWQFLVHPNKKHQIRVNSSCFAGLQWFEQWAKNGSLFSLSGLQANLNKNETISPYL